MISKFLYLLDFFEEIFDWIYVEWFNEMTKSKINSVT